MHSSLKAATAAIGSTLLVAVLLAVVDLGNVAAEAGEDRGVIQQVPLGLPSLPARYATLSAEKVALGRKLFFDRRLSFNNTLSCAMCHLEQDAFASTQSKKSIGMEGRTLKRNAPSLLNVVYQKTFFHDGRETHLDLQSWLPILAFDEMANPSMGYVLDHIEKLDDYPARFQSVYPRQGIAVQTVADAIASFEATLLSGNSRFDKWHYGGQQDALNDVEKKGYDIFTGKGRCNSCHLIGKTTALFTDHQFHNTGIGYRASMLDDHIYVIPLAPGIETRMSAKEIDGFGEKTQNDIGRFEITHKESDRWAYKTPGLRDVSRTAPYMHDGSIATLEDVVDYYSSGAAAQNGTSPNLTKLNLTASEKVALVAFLKSLDGDDQKTTGD
ncbi:MAG: cytochrome C peroxidase [Hyphomicrobiaceae bacterium]|nr:cytochrome C peroxidase [Hyphomicrobiaceae bacterium]MCC0010038.1 cytochrome C peroxidase [Hyphomicrobiaceae bacterium]